MTLSPASFHRFRKFHQIWRRGIVGGLRFAGPEDGVQNQYSFFISEVGFRVVRQRQIGGDHGFTLGGVGGQIQIVAEGAGEYPQSPCNRRSGKRQDGDAAQPDGAIFGLGQKIYQRLSVFKSIPEGKQQPGQKSSCGKNTENLVPVFSVRPVGGGSFKLQLFVVGVLKVGQIIDGLIVLPAEKSEQSAVVFFKDVVHIIQLDDRLFAFFIVVVSVRFNQLFNVIPFVADVGNQRPVQLGSEFEVIKHLACTPGGGGKCQDVRDMVWLNGLVGNPRHQNFGGVGIGFGKFQDDFSVGGKACDDVFLSLVAQQGAFDGAENIGSGRNVRLASVLSYMILQTFGGGVAWGGRIGLRVHSRHIDQIDKFRPGLEFGIGKLFYLLQRFKGLFSSVVKFNDNRFRQLGRFGHFYCPPDTCWIGGFHHHKVSLPFSATLMIGGLA